MSLLNKDDVIKACADAYRTASGRSDGIKAGELAEKIAALSGGAKLLESGEITVTRKATTEARAVKVQLSQIPDLFVMYLESEDETILNELSGATVGCVCINIKQLSHFDLIYEEATATNVSMVIERAEGVTHHNLYLTDMQAKITNEALVRFYGDDDLPVNPNTYYWEAYKLWDEVEA